MNQRLSLQAARELYKKENGAVCNRTSKNALGEQQNKASSPGCAGRIPHFGVKRLPWQRSFLPLALRGWLVNATAQTAPLQTSSTPWNSPRHCQTARTAAAAIRANKD